ncbi:MAG: hypothetical protein PHS04_08475, partial [Tissierellia bacterium]|nr:hypothetical protein [Tissierellia bacterium]
VTDFLFIDCFCHLNHNIISLSNPLTIIFWGRVFSTQVAEYDFSKVLNVMVGAILIYFGIKLLLKK